jgi:hypothetical protein
MTNTSHNVQLTPPNKEWTEEQWTTFRNWIVDHLRAGTISVAFNKKDGTPRIMKCTLNPELLPAQELKEGAREKKENLNIVSVYDLEATSWRSFTVKNVTNVTFNL